MDIPQTIPSRVYISQLSRFAPVHIIFLTVALVMKSKRL